MLITLQVVASLALVVAVLLFMWRLPRRGEALASWAPPLALVSAWCGLAAVILAALLWLLPDPDRWVATGFLLLDPVAIGSGVLVWWILRGLTEPAQTVALQRLQAAVGIALGLVAVTLGYIFVMVHKTPFTPVGG